MRDVVEDTEAAAPGGRLAHLDGLEPRRLAPGHPLGGRRPGQGQGGAADPAHPARHAVPLRRATRSACPTVRSSARTCSTPSGSASGPYYKGRDAERTPMPWNGGPGGGFTRAGRAHLAAHGRPGARATWPTRRATRPPCSSCCRRVIAARGGQRRPGRRLLPLAALARGHLGLPAGRGARRCCSTCPTTRRRSTGVRGTVTRRHRPRPGGLGSRRRAGAPGLERRRGGGLTVTQAAGAPGRRRFVLCTTPAQGHTVPLLAVARRLVEQGHEVVFFTTAHYRERVEATGARFVPFAAAYDAHDLMVANPERESSSKRGVRGRQGRPAPHLHRSDPGPVPGPARHPRGVAADCIVVDCMFLGALPLATRAACGTPGSGLRRGHAVRRRSRDTAPFGIGLQPGRGALSRLRNVSLNWADRARGAGRHPALRPAPAGRGRRDRAFPTYLIDLQP